jgi:hypothetical protein
MRQLTVIPDIEVEPSAWYFQNDPAYAEYMESYNAETIAHMEARYRNEYQSDLEELF